MQSPDLLLIVAGVVLLVLSTRIVTGAPTAVIGGALAGVGVVSILSTL